MECQGREGSFPELFKFETRSRLPSLGVERLIRNQEVASSILAVGFRSNIRCGRISTATLPTPLCIQMSVTERTQSLELSVALQARGVDNTPQFMNGRLDCDIAPPVETAVRGIDRDLQSDFSLRR